MNVEEIETIKQAKKSKKSREMSRVKPARMKMEARKEEIKEWLEEGQGDKRIAKKIGVSSFPMAQYRKYLIEARRGRCRKNRTK